MTLKHESNKTRNVLMFKYLETIILDRMMKFVIALMETNWKLKGLRYASRISFFYICINKRIEIDKCCKAINTSSNIHTMHLRILKGVGGARHVILQKESL